MLGTGWPIGGAAQRPQRLNRPLLNLGGERDELGNGRLAKVDRDSLARTIGSVEKGAGGMGVVSPRFVTKVGLHPAVRLEIGQNQLQRRRQFAFHKRIVPEFEFGEAGGNDDGGATVARGSAVDAFYLVAGLRQSTRLVPSPGSTTWG